MANIRVLAPLAALTMGAFACASSAQAGLVSYTSYSLTGVNATISGPIPAITVGAGQIHLKGTNTGHDVLAWCVDVYDFLKHADTYHTGALTNDGRKSPGPLALSTQQIGRIGALVNHGLWLVDHHGPTYTAAEVGAAIQLSIWSVEYSNFHFSGVNAHVQGLVTTYLDNVIHGAWAPNFKFTTLLHEGNQTLVTGVPEPSTWAMMFIGFIGLAAMSAHRRRQLAAAKAEA